MDSDIYRGVRLAYRLGRQDQQRILEHRLRRQDAGGALADQIRDLAAGMTDAMVDFSSIIRAAEEGSTPLEAVNSPPPVNSERPRSLTALKFRHTETCPRISDPGSECIVCEVFQHLKREQDRHLRYSEGIRAAIGDDRDKRDTGEPAHSDAEEIRKLKRCRGLLKAERETLSDYERLIEEFGFDFDSDPALHDPINWLRNMLAGCRAAKRLAKP